MRLVGPAGAEVDRVGTVSFVHNSLSSREIAEALRKPPRQQDISKVEFSASTFFLKTAGGSPPNELWGRSSL
ncbi:MAG: hypothetical protein ACI9UQ_001081 [Candidatus Krumholzibacteriia bacterium]